MSEECHKSITRCNEACMTLYVCIYLRLMKTFTHSDHSYSTSSTPPLLRGTPDTARILCWNFTPKRHRQLRDKDLPKVHTWQLERDSKPRPFGRKASTQTHRGIEQ